MTDFINGKIKVEESADLFGSGAATATKRAFSEEAQAVFAAGRELCMSIFDTKTVQRNQNSCVLDIKR